MVKCRIEIILFSILIITAKCHSGTEGEGTVGSTDTNVSLLPVTGHTDRRYLQVWQASKQTQLRTAKKRTRLSGTASGP